MTIDETALRASASTSEGRALSPNQLAIWLRQALEPGSIANHLSFAFRAIGVVDPEALHWALTELVARHPALRTTFHEIDGAVVQVEHPTGTVDFAYVDAEELCESDVEELARDELLLPFDLATGPLARFLVLRRSATEHVIITTLHHIITDMWSLTVLYAEWFALHGQRLTGVRAKLLKLRSSVAEHVQTTIDSASTAQAEADRVFWQQQLAGSLDLDLPTDLSPPTHPTGQGGIATVRLDAEVAASMRSLAESGGTSAFAVGLASYACLLQRLTAADDLSIGTPKANRSHRNAGVLGYFINTIVLRLDLGGDPTFGEIVRRAQHIVDTTAPHERYPLQSMVNDTRATRSSSAPIFRTAFLWQKSSRRLGSDFGPAMAVGAPGVRAELSGIVIESMRLDLRPSPADFSLLIGEIGDELAASFEYRRDLFSPELVESIARAWDCLLRAALDDPTRSVADLPLLAEADLDELRAAWSDSDVAPACIHHMIEARAALMADAPALGFGGEWLSYGELNARANRLAHHLVDRGVRRGDYVGVHVERSFEMVVAVLAVLKAGGAYVPLDPEYPAERLAFMVEDCGAQLVITDAATDQVGQVDQVDLRNDDQAIAQQPATDLDVGSQPSDLAYVIYTSGSTGRPKGVDVEHVGVASLFAGLAEHLPIDETDMVIAIASLSFDVSISDIFFPLATGARVLLADRATVVDAPRLRALMRDSGVTLMEATPTTWRMLIEDGWEGDPSLTVVCGAELMPRDLADALVARCGEVWNSYGPTEITVTATMHRVEAGTGSVPIGSAIANTRLYVLDAGARLLPCGVPGELYIGGDGVARGYLGREELTAERFLPDPFCGVDGARMYRTGDLVRRRADGALEYLGRLDTQVKVRGYRIELGEIEAVLARHESVRDVVVAAHEIGPGDMRLSAYVIGAGAAIDAAALRAHVAASLPSYMVPTAFVEVDAFPLTPTKKLDRNALPAPSAEHHVAPSGSVAPLPGTEADLAAIWCDVLGVDHVGRHDNFFELGGHSLLAARIVSRVRRTFAVELPLRSVFDHPTVAALAPELHAGKQRASDARPVEVIERGASHALSHSQARMWFLYQLHPESAAYNMPGAIRLRGALDVEALRRACNDLVERHESLRTYFAMVDDESRQMIAAQASVVMPVIDYAAIDPADRDHVLAARLRADARRPFVLEELPLFDVVLHRLADDEHVLYMSMHHIISDQWSFGILGAEIAELYSARVAGRAPHLAPMQIQHVDYIGWHEEWLSSGVLDEQLAYWRTQLRDLPVLDLPADRARPVVQAHVGSYVMSDIPDDIVAGLRGLSQELHASPFAITLAAFDVLLHRYTGVSDVVVGTAIANRTFLESEGLISSFVNTLVMRSDLTGDPTFAALVRRVQNTAHDSYANQDVPFARLVEELQPARDLSRSPFFQVFFNMQNAVAQPPTLGGLEVEIVPIDRGSSQFDLSMSIDIDIDRSATIEFNTELFDEARIERLFGHYWTLLSAALADPSRVISALPLATAAERDAEQHEWVSSATTIDEAATVHGHIERQAQATPERVAVQFAGATLTYGELNARANQLAAHLRSLDVASGDLVGVYLERSLEMVVSVLAVLKTGAAYVPLDPAFPHDRLAFMVADSETRVVLTDTFNLEAGAPQWPGVTFVDVDRDRALFDAFADHDVAVPAGARDLAYVIYTSGSTGKPKGVELEHRSVVNFLESMQATLDLSRDDILLSVTTLSFDIAVLELFVPLITGARVVVASRETVVDAPRLRAELVATGATVMQATPTTWRMLIEDGWSGDPTLTVVCGGEAMSRELADALLARCATLWNAYGPTETTVWSSMQRVVEGSGPVPIGSAIANTRLYVLDARGELLPAGVPGELFIGGDGLARGYLRREELTNERFVPDPFSDAPGARMYRTGDLVRRRSDGALEYLGRLDTQVKVRGYRIELGEIESVLARHASVREAVVAAREFAPGDVRLVAYVIADDPVEPATLRAHAQAELPSYMVPVAFVEVDAFPLTPNKKVDRNALPLPSSISVASVGAMPSEPPLPGLESQLAAIWRDVLGIEQVGRHDNFFELGGHSLLAVRVFAQLQNITGCALPLTSLFRAPTIAGIVELVRNDGWHPRFTSLVEVKPEGVGQPFFHVAPFLITALSFSHLARALGDDHPLYGFQPQGLEDEQDIHSTVHEMAAHYIDEMKQVQPYGPYAIGGHCAGSWVAFEMAQQLQANGDEVNALVLVDAEPPNFVAPRIGHVRYVARRLAYYSREGRLRDALRWKFGLAWQRLLVRRVGSPGQRRAATVRVAHASAHAQYRSDVVEGDALFVRSLESATLSDKDWHLMWEELITGELTTVVVPGSHAALVEEGPSRDVAEAIRSVLAGR